MAEASLQAMEDKGKMPWAIV
ncbi:MAG: hypothetical protein JWN05_2409, partial [Arthrobacter sp.]|nr:hypothetical protein [Arthrobacter sp.]